MCVLNEQERTQKRFHFENGFHLFPGDSRYCLLWTANDNLLKMMSISPGINQPLRSIQTLKWVKAMEIDFGNCVMFLSFGLIHDGSIQGVTIVSFLLSFSRAVFVQINYERRFIHKKRTHVVKFVSSKNWPFDLWLRFVFDSNGLFGDWWCHNRTM